MRGVTAAPDLAEIRATHDRIRPYVHRTPVLTSERLDRHCHSRLYFKCENLQKAGAFKSRGACNAVFSFAEAELPEALATHSSGNHGAALARAATLRKIPSWIVMPDNAPRVKKDAVRAYGGQIVECEPTLKARERALETVVADHGAAVVHPYDDPRVIAGQGTVALELLEQVEQLDVVVIPVGGGGLLAGMATAIKALRPEIEVLAAEPAGADDAFRSFGLGRWVPQENPQTIADGLLTSLGQLNYEVIRNHVDTILTVEESSIIEAMKMQWTRLKTLSEPSGAVTFAAVLEHGERFRGRRAACVISGGNVDLQKLPW